MPNFADWTPVTSLPPATEELHRRTRLLVLDGEPDRGFVCRKLDDGSYEWYEIVKEQPLATGGGHPDLADHELIGLVTETDLTTHAADATAVHGIADTADLVLTDDARLSDARTPTTHSATSLHSFPGGTTNFLREDGTFALPVGQHPDLATHDTLGLATQAELDALDFEAAGAVAAHEANGNPHSVYALDTDLTTHAGAADPHTGYVQEAAVPGGELGGTYATPTVDATHSGSTHAATQAAAEATAASALTTHAGAVDPHTGYLKENDPDFIDLTDGTSTALHSHSAAHPDLATHDTLGLATQAELDTHAAGPHGGAPNIKQTEIDFGNVVRLTEKAFTITDVDVSTGSQILASVLHKSPSDARSIDEIQCESFDIQCAPASGTFGLIMRSRCGSVMGKFIVAYLVGSAVLVFALSKAVNGRIGTELIATAHLLVVQAT